MIIKSFESWIDFQFSFAAKLKFFSTINYKRICIQIYTIPEFLFVSESLAQETCFFPLSEGCLSCVLTRQCRGSALPWPELGFNGITPALRPSDYRLPCSCFSSGNGPPGEGGDASQQRLGDANDTP